MPLAEFIAEAMGLLASDDNELAVGPALSLRSAAGEGWTSTFARMNP
jgi:hypothetical protein